MNKNNLWRLSASEIAKATTAGEIRTVDVITSAVDRMKQVNPSLNAVVVDLSEKAIETADLLDRDRDNNKCCGPLHGVPITIKINVDQKGHATSNGVSALKDWIAPDDAPIVKNLQKAGAIIIVAPILQSSHLELIQIMAFMEEQIIRGVVMFLLVALLVVLVRLSCRVLGQWDMEMTLAVRSGSQLQLMARSQLNPV